MADERALQAMNRIERALARIEASAEKRSGAGASETELTELRERHETLRAKVEDAVSEIDRLLETREGA